MDWIWSENSILSRPIENMPCGAIFQAVTDELGRYYIGKGLQYFPSKPKVVYRDAQIKLEICFWSSRSNIPGEYVHLEVLPNFYAPALRESGKGFLLGHTDLFYCFQTDGSRKRIYKNGFNVYGLTTKDFQEITATIDRAVLPWIQKLKTLEGINEIIQNRRNCPPRASNSALYGYIKLYFPDLETECITNLKENG